MIIIRHSGSFKNIERFLKNAQEKKVFGILDRYGKEGVRALSYATPKDTTFTASSWGYEVQVKASGYSINWTNSNVVNGVPIAIILQYGHGTRNGGYVEGRDYINPALQPIFDKLAEDLWKEVISS